MSRQLRIEFEGAVYHVLARGDRREAIFIDDEDRKCFLNTLAEACGMTGWKVYAWILMSNHYHLVVETPEANLVAGMRWIQNTYTRRFNSRHKLWGHVFGGRYKSILVEEGSYSRQLVDYVHLNAVRAGLVKREKPEDLLAYPWSSLAREYVLSPGKRSKWMDPSRRLEVAADEESVKHRKRYLAFLQGVAVSGGKEAGRSSLPESSLQSTLTRGWYWGSEEFRDQLLKRTKKGPGGNVNYRSSPLSVDQNRLQAESIVREGLRRSGLDDKKMGLLKGSHPVKVVIALAVRARTIEGNSWLADRLKMKTAGNVSQLCRRYKRGEIHLPKDLEAWLESVKNA